MFDYHLIKLIHIISATILVGTGFGTAFFLFMAVRSDSRETIRITSRHVILADWLFTAPSVIIQPVTGGFLMQTLGLSFSSTWFVLVVVLYVLAGACWIPVLWIQYRLRKLSETDSLTPEFHRLMRVWIGLGIPAFLAMLVLYYLMVFKPYIS